MRSQRRAPARRAAVVALLILAAMACRRIGLEGRLRLTMGYLRSGIYLGLFAAWGVSVRRRVVQVQARRHLTAIAALMVFWLAIRTVKYFAAFGPDVGRRLWYLYYLPMLFIPLFAVFAAFSLGRPEDFRLRPWTSLLYLPTAALLALVLTNDLHRLVFVFPSGPSSGWERRYGYAAGYWLTLGWMALCGLTAMVVMALKCRVPRSKTVLWLPVVPMGLAAAYAVAMVCRVRAVHLLMGDVTVSLCLLFASFFECCIRCGLIQSNAHYAELFRKIGSPAAILDGDNVPRYVSAAGLNLSPEELRRAQTGPAELPDRRLARSMPVTGGRIVWTEDVSELLTLRRELEDAAGELAGEKDLLEAEIAMKERQAVTDTRSRLYDSVTRELAPQFAELGRLASAAREPSGRDGALRRMCVIGAYVKRRCNLLILGEEERTVSSAELGNCLRESADYIRLYGAACTLSAAGESRLPVVYAALAYDLFEEIVEGTLSGLAALLIRLDARDGGAELRLQAECAEPAPVSPALRARIAAAGGAAAAVREDGTYYVNLLLPGREKP